MFTPCLPRSRWGAQNGCCYYLAYNAGTRAERAGRKNQTGFLNLVHSLQKDFKDAAVFLKTGMPDSFLLLWPIRPCSTRSRKQRSQGKTTTHSHEQMSATFHKLGALVSGTDWHSGHLHSLRDCEGSRRLRQVAGRPRCHSHAHPTRNHQEISPLHPFLEHSGQTCCVPPYRSTRSSATSLSTSPFRKAWTSSSVKTRSRR